MSSRCVSDSCINGNCEGCKDSNLFCNDPRCYPNCPDCPQKNNSNSNDWVIALIILILAGVLLIFAIITGFDYWNKTQMAAEPKNVTVNTTTIPPVTIPPVTIPPATIPPPAIDTNTYMSPKSCPTNTTFEDFTLNSSTSCDVGSSQIEGFE